MVAIARKTKNAAADKVSSPVKEKASTKTTTKEKSSSKKKVTVIEQFMRRFTKDTPGTLRFEAISQDGKVLQRNVTEITQLYVERSSPAMQNDPRFLKITVEVLNKLPGSTADDDE